MPQVTQHRLAIAAERTIESEPEAATPGTTPTVNINATQVVEPKNIRGGIEHTMHSASTVRSKIGTQIRATVI